MVHDARSNKPALWAQLLRARVVTSPSTFDEFVSAFTSSANANFIDTGSAPVENKVAGMLAIHAAQPWLKRVVGRWRAPALRRLPIKLTVDPGVGQYIVGVHPTSCRLMAYSVLCPESESGLIESE